MFKKGLKLGGNRLVISNKLGYLIMFGVIIWRYIEWEEKKVKLLVVVPRYRPEQPHQTDSSRRTESHEKQ